MWLELLSPALYLFHVDVRRNVGLVLKGSVDQVRRAVRLARFLPIRGIEIIGYEQPQDSSCAFLSQLRGIHFVRLFAYRLTDIESLQALKELRHIEIAHVASGQSIAIDFGSFPDLERVALEWFSGAESIFDAVRLKSLNLMRYRESSSAVLRKLTALTQLRLTDCGLRDVGALRQFPSLRWLALHSLSNLEDFAALSAHPTLAFLWIEACRKLRRLDWLSHMNKLQTLQILDCGEISGIEVIQTLPRLRHIHIHGAVKIVADDLSFLRDLSNLESVVLKGLPDADVDYWRRRNRRYHLLRPDLVQ